MIDPGKPFGQSIGFDPFRKIRINSVKVRNKTKIFKQYYVISLKSWVGGWEKRTSDRDQG
jgi:hypothetical protein